MTVTHSERLFRLLTLFPIFGTAIGAFQFFQLLRILNNREILALSGDEQAAKVLVLPIYKELVKVFMIFNIVFCIVNLWPLFSKASNVDILNSIEYYAFMLLVLYSFMPTLLLRKDVKLESFLKTFFILWAWWCVCTSIWIASVTVDGDPDKPTYKVYAMLQIIFWVVSVAPPVLLCVGLLSKKIKSRVNLKSTQFRGNIEFVLGFSVIYIGTNVVYLLDRNDERKEGESYTTIAVLLSGVSFIFNLFFPWQLYRTALADTKFWRGIGTNFQGGIREDSETAISPVNIAVASSHMQDMMSNVGRALIDFSRLKINDQIGTGSSAKVYKGIYKGKEVAVKVTTPIEISEEVIANFVKETSICRNLSHPNIVNFYGICVRTPQIALVLEYCHHGDLKSCLQKYRKQWTPKKKLLATIHAVKAVEYLHSKMLIHRDLKCDNFFVDEKFTVKLGDFGESASSQTSHRTILGTISYMAPELIERDKNSERGYTEKVDIYALAVTMWEIWTMKEPFANVDRFKLYSQVLNGLRPGAIIDAPLGFMDVINAAWLHDADARPPAAFLVAQLETIYQEYLFEIGDLDRNSFTESPIDEEKMAAEIKRRSIKRNSVLSFLGFHRDESNPGSVQTPIERHIDKYEGFGDWDTNPKLSDLERSSSNKSRASMFELSPRPTDIGAGVTLHGVVLNQEFNSNPLIENATPNSEV